MPGEGGRGQRTLTAPEVTRPEMGSGGAVVKGGERAAAGLWLWEAAGGSVHWWGGQVIAQLWEVHRTARPVRLSG